MIYGEKISVLIIMLWVLLGIIMLVYFESVFYLKCINCLFFKNNNNLIVSKIGY